MKNIKQLIFPVFMMLLILVMYFTFNSLVIRKGMTTTQVERIQSLSNRSGVIPGGYDGPEPTIEYDFEFKNDSLVNWKRR